MFPLVCRRVSVSVGENVLDELTYMTLEEWPEEAGDQLVKDAGSSIDVSTISVPNAVQSSVIPPSLFHRDKSRVQVFDCR